MNVEKRLSELGYTLPVPQGPKASYVVVRRSGPFIFTAGMSAFAGDELKYRGKLGRELGVKEGYESARLTALNLLSVLKQELGDLDEVKGIVKLLVFINCTEDFSEHPAVANGASDLFREVFGEKGAHARSAVGANSLPMNCSVEIEMIVEVGDA
jgi:enamine deaminase RidA (YjgF/YER057c/UK114 family)